MTNFKRKYEDLEQQVLKTLRKNIENSDYISKTHNIKAIPVNVFDYTELTVIDGSLTFLDSKGYNYSLYADCTLEDLIDIISKRELCN